MSGSLAQPNTGSMTLASGAAGAFPVGFGYYPPEGSRVVSAQYLWTTQLSYNEDLSQLVARGIETSIQSAWIDNSACSFPVVMTIGGTQQTIVIPPYSFGMYPVFFTGTPSFNITSAGANNNAVGGFSSPALTRVLLLNVPASPEVVSSLVPPAGGVQSVLGFASVNTLKVGPGRVSKIYTQTAVAVGTITLNDSLSPGTVNTGNTILALPIGTAANTLITLEWPFLNGLILNYNGGATGVVNVTWE